MARAPRADLDAESTFWAGILDGTARDLAKVYAACVGEVDGGRLLSERTVSDLTAFPIGSEVTDPAPLDALRWGTGFMIDPHGVRPMLGRGSFGHDGADGSLAFGNTRLDASLAYITNQMGGLPDQRANALSAALRGVLDA